MNKNKKKSSPMVGIIVFGLIILSAFSDNLSGETVAAVITFVFVASILTAVFKAALSGKKSKASGSPMYDSEKKQTYHSHDRLSENNLRTEAHNELEHYKRQLDGFLEAGIIDRTEYRTLLDKYSRTVK